MNDRLTFSRLPSMNDKQYKNFMSVLLSAVIHADDSSSAVSNSFMR